jgi:hypothetical protein
MVDQPGSNWALGSIHRRAFHEELFFTNMTTASAKTRSRPSGCLRAPRSSRLAGEPNPGGLMDRIALSAALLCAAVLLSDAAQAMEIQQFDKMASQDRSDYVASLVMGTQQVLTDEGRPDLVDQIHKLFTETPVGDEASIGMTEFMRNLARARVADAERAAADSNAHRLEVEDAMLVTLQKNNIPVPQGFVRAFRAINSNFRPQ